MTGHPSKHEHYEQQNNNMNFQSQKALKQHGHSSPNLHKGTSKHAQQDPMLIFNKS
jgi:hypothetical protein